MIKTVLASALVVALGSFAAHADQGSGVVNFKGTVIDAPCGIDANSADQTIDFGQISKSHLEGGNNSEQKKVAIKLVNCDVTNVTKGVTLTFAGGTVAGQNSELATAGGTNVAIKMNGYGKDIEWNSATDYIPIATGDTNLEFQAWVKKASGVTDPVKEGDFTAVTNFTLAYQ